MVAGQNKLPVSVVLPLYQPRDNWSTQFMENKEKLNAFLPHVSFRYIVVHDGPVDAQLENMFEVLQSTCNDVIFHAYDRNRGKGFALRYGVAKTETSFTIVMDFDFPYSLKDIARIIKGLQEGYSAVTGRRKRKYFKLLPLKRKVISLSYCLCNRLFFCLPVNDTQSGLKGFNKTGKAVFLQTRIDRFLVDTEFLLRAASKKIDVKVIDLHHRPDISFSNFGYKVLQAELRNFFYLLSLQYRLNRVDATVDYKPVTVPHLKAIKSG